jgi:putative phage-type endonuclease
MSATLVARKEPIVCDLTQGSNGWALWRAQGIGSSDAPAIMGVSPWSTALQLFELKTGKREPQATNAAMQRGSDLELYARREFEFEHGGDFPPACLIHPDYPFLGASLDGWNPEQSTVVEIKCPGRADLELARNGKVPPKYLPQVMHLLLVSGADRCLYVTYDQDAGCISLTVERDEPYIALLLEKEIAFWRCVETDTPPDPTEADVEHRDDEDWEAAARDYRLAYQTAAEAEADVKHAREVLLTLAGGRRCEGFGVKVTPYPRLGAVDYRAAGKELADILGEPVDWDKWRKPTTTEVRVTVEGER